MGQAEHSRIELLHEEFIRYVVNIRCKLTTGVSKTGSA